MIDNLKAVERDAATRLQGKLRVARACAALAHFADFYGVLIKTISVQPPSAIMRTIGTTRIRGSPNHTRLQHCIIVGNLVEANVNCTRVNAGFESTICAVTSTECSMCKRK